MHARVHRKFESYLIGNIFYKSNFLLQDKSRFQTAYLPGICFCFTNDLQKINRKFLIYMNRSVYFFRSFFFDKCRLKYFRVLRGENRSLYCFFAGCRFLWCSLFGCCFAGRCFGFCGSWLLRRSFLYFRFFHLGFYLYGFFDLCRSLCFFCRLCRLCFYFCGLCLCVCSTQKLSLPTDIIHYLPG